MGEPAAAQDRGALMATCTELGCGRSSSGPGCARGLCARHYQAARRHGGQQPAPRPEPMVTLEGIAMRVPAPVAVWAHAQARRQRISVTEVVRRALVRASATAAE